MKGHVVLGVTGSLEAYQAIDLVRQLKKKQISVEVIMTAGATKFVSPLTFEAVSENPVHLKMLGPIKHYDMEHISLARKADLFVVMPATANHMGKMAAGLADNLLTSSLLATKAPVLIVPALTKGAEDKEGLQDNIKKLKGKGYYLMGEEQMPSLLEISGQIEILLHPTKRLQGKRVVISAGPTREAIDPVRYLSNFSSGKMGFALARAARLEGADVTLISGPTGEKDYYGAKVIPVTTTESMYQAVYAHYEEADLVIKSAAVLDYKPKNPAQHKLKKQAGDLSIPLTRTKDILSSLGQEKTHQFLVGFAAESQDHRKYGQGKLERKNLDMIVINDIGRSDIGFASDENEAILLHRDLSERKLQKMSKAEMAQVIIDEICLKMK